MHCNLVMFRSYPGSNKYYILRSGAYMREAITSGLALIRGNTVKDFYSYKLIYA